QSMFHDGFIDEEAEWAKLVAQKRKQNELQRSKQASTSGKMSEYEILQGKKGERVGSWSGVYGDGSKSLSRRVEREIEDTKLMKNQRKYWKEWIAKKRDQKIVLSQPIIGGEKEVESTVEETVEDKKGHVRGSTIPLDERKKKTQMIIPHSSSSEISKLSSDIMSGKQKTKQQGKRRYSSEDSLVISVKGKIKTNTKKKKGKKIKKSSTSSLSTLFQSIHAIEADVFDSKSE
ncbi:hypothetical protein ADUPG1_013358, partial [Aduncisulcus paluster]